MRNFNIVKYSFLFIFLIILIPCFSQDNAKDNIISFESYMNLISAELPEMHQNQNKVELAKNEVKKANELHNVELSSNFSGIGKQTYPDGKGTELYSTGFNTQTMLSTTLPSGTIVGAGFDYTQMYSNGLTEVMNFSPMGVTSEDKTLSTVTYDPIIKINIAQPLIFNWFGFLDRFAKKDAKMKLEIERLKKIENDKMILDYYKKIYFSWIAYSDIISLLERSIQNAIKLEKQTREKLRTGIAENDDLQKVIYQVFKYQEQHQMTISEYENILNELSIFFDTSASSPDNEELSLFFKKSADITPDLVEFENTRNSKIINLSKAELEYVKKASFNKTLPMLNAFGNLDIKFHQFEKTLDNDAKDPEIFYGDIDFTVGLEFRYPLGNFKSRAELKETELMIKDLLLQYESSRNQYNKGIKAIITNIKSFKKVYEIKEKSLGSLNSRYKTEKRKYNQARLDLAFLLDTDNAITSEEIELVRMKINLINLYFDYLNITE